MRVKSIAADFRAMLILVFFAGFAAAAIGAEHNRGQAGVEAAVAKLSDSQARQMLIDELQKSAGHGRPKSSIRRCSPTVCSAT